MRRKKTAAMLPKPRPDPFHVRLRHLQGSQRRARKKTEPPLPMRRRQRLQPLPDFEQKHQPMTLSLIPVFADDARQVQIRRPYLQPEFFPGFPARAGMRRLPRVSAQLSTARTPQPQVRLLRPFQQQHLIPAVEAVKQRCNFVGKIHLRSLRHPMKIHRASPGKRFPALRLPAVNLRNRTRTRPLTPDCRQAGARRLRASAFGSPKVNHFVSALSDPEEA